MFCEKYVLKNFPDFTGKQLCWSLFLVKLQVFSGMQISQNKETPTQAFFVKYVKFLRTPTLKNIYKRLLLNFYFGKATLAKYNEVY